MLDLACGDYRLSIDPALGGAIMAFDWRGEPVFRPADGPCILDSASFPLVPFSNRIAHGRFNASGHQVHLRPNFPGRDHPHTLHGFGWLAPWEIIAQNAKSAQIAHRYDAEDWPWPYVATQHFSLNNDGLTVELSVRHNGSTPMPCGLGLHPRFPCNNETILRALHCAEVLVDADRLPIETRHSKEPLDYWHGQPVASRHVDTGYLGRVGPIIIQWPDRHMEAVVTPSASLRHTVIYTPAETDFFCVEPVTHQSNSFNAPESAQSDHIMLAPGEEFAVSCRFMAQPMA